MEAEIKGQLEPLMATLTTEPKYHFWGNGTPMVLEGRAAVASFYSGMFSTGRQQFEVVVAKVMASSDNVVTEGQVKQVNRGRDLKAAGMSTVGDTRIEDNDLWLSNAQLVTVWPADTAGKLIGEDIYFGVNPMQTLSKISASDLPPYYKL